MNNMDNKKFIRPEILAPAGNFEKMTAAIRFGADAVYLAGREFGMRTAADNFSEDELKKAAEALHSLGKKLYLTVNTLPRADEYPRLRQFLTVIKDFGIDGFIAADLGVIALIKEIIPEGAVHISTQASICSPAAAKAYASLGASRLVLARELSLGEIRQIREALPESVELEAFVHGSMCVSWSGRCMLSNMLTGRDANRGSCAQPCRWNYTLIEEKRPDMRIPVEETPLGTFVMSSKDMCMIEHVGELADAGVGSFKIEGRVKSAYYAAVVANAYKNAVCALEDYVLAGGNAADFRPQPEIYDELMCVSHREYCTGFYFDSPAENPQLVTQPGYVRDKAYLALIAGDTDIPAGIEKVNEKGKIYAFTQKNKLFAGDTVEILSPGRTGRSAVLAELYDTDGNAIESTPHPNMLYFARLPFDADTGDIVRAH